MQAWPASEIVKAISAAAEVSRKQLTDITNAYTEAMQPLLEAARSQVASLTTSSFVDWAARASEMLKRAFPPNWAELEPGEIKSVIERVHETGFTLVWIPRIEIVREVLAVSAPDTAAVLLAHRDEVLDNAAACPEKVTDSDLAPTREVIEQAIAALRSGLSHPAQAAAAAAFTSEGHRPLREGHNWCRPERDGGERSRNGRVRPPPPMHDIHGRSESAGVLLVRLRSSGRRRSIVTRHLTGSAPSSGRRRMLSQRSCSRRRSFERWSTGTP